MFGWVRETTVDEAMAMQRAAHGVKVAELEEDLAYAELEIRSRGVELDRRLAELVEMRGQLESQINATHVRGRSIDWLAGEVDAAQEDARAAKVLAFFWMQSWLSALSGDAPKEITA